MAPGPEALYGGTKDPVLRNHIERPSRSTMEGFSCQCGHLGKPQVSVGNGVVCQANPSPINAKKRRIARARSSCSDGVGNVDITGISDAFFSSNACICEFPARINVTMAILSIQSRVISGYVGNAAATPVLQRLGHTVWPIDTVTFSNHPAHGSYTGGYRPTHEINALVKGLQARSLLSECDGLLSGYLGVAETGIAVRNAAALVRNANSTAFWCCDPVMGDNGAFYVEDGIPEFFRDHAVPSADIVMPNVFEASYLTGQMAETCVEAKQAATVLLGQGPKVVIITGIRQNNSIGALLATANGMWLCMAPTVDVAASGAGDVFAALFIGYYLNSRDVQEALGCAVTGVHTVLRATADAQAIDLRLVAALPALENLKALPVEKVR